MMYHSAPLSGDFPYAWVRLVIPKTLEERMPTAWIWWKGPHGIWDDFWPVSYVDAETGKHLDVPRVIQEAQAAAFLGERRRLPRYARWHIGVLRLHEKLRPVRPKRTWESRLIQRAPWLRWVQRGLSHPKPTCRT